MYDIYYHPEVIRELQSKTEKEIGAIHHRIDRLRNGQWKNGTRVKKLHITSGQIWEARIDRAHRLLFTIMPKKDQISKAAIYLFRVSLDHDDVIRVAKNLFGDACDFERFPIEESQASFQDVLNVAQREWHNQIWFNDYVDGLKFYDLSEDDWIRFISKSEVDLNAEWEFKLKLSEEQRHVMNEPLPLLLAGTAGSGKTTILIHRLLTQTSQRKIYITTSDNLCDEARKMFRSIVKGLDDEKSYIDNTEFMTFDTLLNQYKRDPLEHVMTQDRFIHEYVEWSRTRSLEDFPALMVWEEIRSIWKSGRFSQNEHITLAEYIKLSQQEAPNFYKLRKEAYKIFQWYQEFLSTHHLKDELDLIRECIPRLKNNNFYSLVECDEVQDLTHLHVELLFTLAQYEPHRLILTGDDHQVVHHSGFRWENVKQAFFEKLNCRVSALHKLTRNFRNVGNIVRLANQINVLQEQWTEFEYKTRSENAVAFGETPKVYLNIPENSLVTVLSRAGASQAVLVRDERSKDELKSIFEQNSLQTPLIFTIPQAKGLEFNSVLLWKVSVSGEQGKDNWASIMRRKSRGELNQVQQRFVRREISQLYVGITRAMKHCFIYEGPALSDFWSLEPLHDYLEFERDESFIKSFWAMPSSEEEWFRQGMYLFDKGAFEQAIDCLERIEQSQFQDDVTIYVIICKANLASKNGKLRDAAELYLSVGKRDEAARCYDRAGLYDAAVKLYRSRRDYPIRRKYEIKKWDSLQQWRISAIYCVQEQWYTEAAVRFERFGDLESAIRYYKLGGDAEGVRRCTEEMWKEPSV